MKDIRLYWGENYAPKPLHIQKIITAAFDQAASSAHLYPGGLLDDCKKCISEEEHVALDSITLGVGIEGLLATIFSTFLKKGDRVATLDPTFSGYAHMVEHNQGSIIPMLVGLKTKLSAQHVLAKAKQAKIMCIASPNTSTGFYHLDAREIEKILQNFPGLVLIDECYFGIGNETVLSLVAKYKNCIVLRSFSKAMGLAGIRLGIAFGPAKLITQIEYHTTAVAPDPIMSASLLVAASVYPYRYALGDTFIQFQQQFAKKLAVALPQCAVMPSQATFLPVILPKSISVVGIVGEMKEKFHILLKDTTPLRYLLVGVPPKEEWDYVLSSFAHSLGKYS